METSNYKKDKYKLNEPILYPPLKKSINELDIDEEKSEELGTITINLLKLRDISIYKLLYYKGSNSEFSEGIEVRNEFLKKLLKQIINIFIKNYFLKNLKGVQM